MEKYWEFKEREQWNVMGQSAGASAWGGIRSPGSKEKSVIELQNMIDHCNKRFECLDTMLEKNKTLTIVIPTNFEIDDGVKWECRCTTENKISKEGGTICRLCKSGLSNMGKGRAFNQWKSRYGDTFKYSDFIQNLDKKIDELHKKYYLRVSFGRLIKNLDEPNRIQLWGANLKNYDNRASKGNIIKGSGQAAFLKKHTQSTYGIITTPVGGVPQQGTKDFDMNRLCSRNPSVSVSQGGTSARSLSRVGKPNNRGILSRGQSSFRLQNTKHKVIDNFKPSTKINVPKRKVQQFIDDFKKASKSKGGYKLAKKELEDGEKKNTGFGMFFHNH